MKSWLVTSQNGTVRMQNNSCQRSPDCSGYGPEFSWCDFPEMVFRPESHLICAEETPVERHGWIWLFMCNLLSLFCPENFVLYFSIILLNNLQDNFLQRKLVLGFISMTLGYLLSFNPHKLRNQVLPVVASPSILLIVHFQFSQAIWQLQVFLTACYEV